MLETLYSFLFFAVPITLFTFFGLSIYEYVSAKKQNKAFPGTFSEKEIKKRKITLIVLSAVTGIFVIIVIVLSALMFMSLAFM